jgi:hypothetical protein
MYGLAYVDGNKLDAGKNKKILAKLKSRKIQVW